MTWIARFTFILSAVAASTVLANAQPYPDPGAANPSAAPVPSPIDPSAFSPSFPTFDDCGNPLTVFPVPLPFPTWVPEDVPIIPP